MKNYQKLFFLWIASILLFFSGCEINVPEEGREIGRQIGQEVKKQVEQELEKKLEQEPEQGQGEEQEPEKGKKKEKKRKEQQDAGSSKPPSASSDEYRGEAYQVLNDNIPQFTKKQKKSKKAFEKYSALDSLGRCGVAFANICKELMPTEERGNIGRVKPSGWHTVKYDIVEGKYLYNRCHLIGFQLAGENANEKNLITGTRYLNVEGMLPFENEVADYVEETGNHVLYRVTPQYEGNDLLAQGVQMEGYSVEDRGEGICFNVFVYNVQPGIEIDYSTGDSREETGAAAAQ